MRLVEDMEVADLTTSADERVDLLLGGHDHHVVRRKYTDTNSDPGILEEQSNQANIHMTHAQGLYNIIKSGTDWRGLSVLKLQITKDKDAVACLSDMTGRSQLLDFR